MPQLPRILFVTYGAGHVNALLPVARALQQQRLAEVNVVGLTTAGPAVRAAGLPLLQFRDLLVPSDIDALRWGAELAKALAPSDVVDGQETIAYLGLCYADLVDEHGVELAREQYARFGRHCFLPVRTMTRALNLWKPDLVVITNAPRAERAAGLAARALGIPALCVNILFAIDEIEWLRDPLYCTRICVLNEEVKSFFMRAGRPEAHLLVTGNPAFDALSDSSRVHAGEVLRQRLGGQSRRLVLWASQPELPSHPTVPGKVGDPGFPDRITRELLQWAHEGAGRTILVRPHPSEPLPAIADPRAMVCSPREFAIADLLHAVDLVVTMTSTVGAEAHFAGKPVIQVLGSIFDHTSPFADMGIAQAVTLEKLATIMDEALNKQSWTTGRSKGEADATGKVVKAILEML